MNSISSSSFLTVSVIVLLVGALGLTSCSSIPTSGPSRKQIYKPEESSKPIPPIKIVDIDDATAKRLLASEKRGGFADVFSANDYAGYRVGAGDILEVSVWEAPPATLFGSVLAIDSHVGAAATRATTFPEQMVSNDGTINVPFAGMVPAAGKSPQEVETEIVKRLKGKANQPQVMVRVIRNVTSNVTVVGEVVQSTRMPLTAKRERLLDAIAAAGGVRQPVNKVTVQLTRGNLVHAMPLESVIEAPRENVPLSPGDVVTVHFQPLSFSVLGATGKNEEINFEAQGISLAQAMARSGGVQDSRADAQGIFLFRFEDPLVMEESTDVTPVTPDGKVPVVYRLDMKNPAAFLVAQNFPMRNRDVVYVANAPAAEMQKFLNILTSSVFSISNLINLGK